MNIRGPNSSKFIEAVGGVIVRKGNILLIKRAKHKESYPGHWVAVGGGVEDNEIAEDAIKREVKEETGLDFIPEQYLGAFIVPEDGFVLRAHRFLGDLNGQEISLNEEADDYGWFNYDECQNLDIGFHYQEMIEYLNAKSILT